MKDRFLFLLSLLAAVTAVAPNALAQDPPTALVDRISSINGDSGFASDAAGRYFNRADCGLDDGTGGAGGTGGSGGVGGIGGSGGVGGFGGFGFGGFGGFGFGGFFGAPGGISAAVQKGDPATTSFEIRLQESGSAVSDVYLWAGGEGANCNRLENRNETMGLCGEVAGNPQSVGINATISGLTLQDLLNARAGSTELLNCESSGLTGTPYQIFVFRNSPPGGDDVDPANYGIVNFFIDVQAPAAPQVNTSPQRQSSFSITWPTPDPPDDIELWQFYFSDTDDPSNAVEIAGATVGNQDATSATIDASSIPLAEGDSGFIFAKAFDFAYVSNDAGGNQSDFSQAVPVTNVAVGGFCDVSGECGGCSVSHANLADKRGPGSVAWALGLMFILAGIWRLRR